MGLQFVFLALLHLEKIKPNCMIVLWGPLITFPRDNFDNYDNNNNDSDNNNNNKKKKKKKKKK